MILPENQHITNRKTGSQTPEMLAIDVAPCGIIIFDSELKIIRANPAASNLVVLSDAADIILQNGTDEKIWGNWHQVLNEVINTGKAKRFDNLDYCCSQIKRILQITITPIIGFGGMLILDDITEKSEAQKHYAHTERLAVLGKLASKIAHELNNPIDGIMRYINLAKRTVSEDANPKIIEYLDHSLDGLDRMTHIIAELLEFSRSRTSDAKQNNIDKIIDDAVKFIIPSAEIAGVKIVKNYPVNMPAVRGGNLFQVFCNLLKNSVEATPDGGKVIISASASNGVLEIAISDTGSGIAAEHIETIFEPFFTTKISGKGTGLGLAISRDIVEKVGGRITAENLDDGGSVFKISLPI